MAKFARLFEIGEDQLLVTLTSDEYGNPVIINTTEIDGIEVSTTPLFKSAKDISEERREKMWKAHDEYLTALDQKKAEEIYHALVDQHREFSKIDEDAN